MLPGEEYCRWLSFVYVVQRDMNHQIHIVNLLIEADPEDEFCSIESAVTLLLAAL